MIRSSLYTHSGLFQNEASRVCEDCDQECLGGCRDGAVRNVTYISNYHHNVYTITTLYRVQRTVLLVETTSS